MDLRGKGQAEIELRAPTRARLIWGGEMWGRNLVVFLDFHILRTLSPLRGSVGVRVRWMGIVDYSTMRWMGIVDYSMHNAMEGDS